MSSKAIKVYVDGQEGTTGLRIHEMLARRSDVEVLKIDPDKRKDPAERARLLNASDVSFLCLPDAASKEAAGMVTNPSTCLIDASTAHRTAAGWVFGLPELAPDQRAKLREGKRIANPGCHASAFILAVRPLVDAGLIAPDTGLAANSITGYSGGGKSMIAQYEAGGDPKLMAPRPYALGLAHKHLPEMKAHTGLTKAPVFEPIVGPFYKGLAVSIPLQPSQLRAGADAAAVRDALAARYEGERYVRVAPLNDADALAAGTFDVMGSNDSNRCDLFVFSNAEGQVLLISRLDNLGKGASGAAVQSMNVHFGLDESLGLD